MDCIAAGHDVKLFITTFPDGTRRTAGDGLVPRVADYHPWLKWADLIFPTGNAALMKERDKLISEGFPIFGAGTLGCKLEIDREFAMKLLERHGVEMVPYQYFDNIDKAQEFLKKNGGNWVIKPEGDNADKSLTFLASNPDFMEEEIANTLETWRKQGKAKGKILLQEFMPGIEIGLGCFFGSKGFSQWKSIAFEHKKLMSKNFGPNTGEMGTVMQWVKESRIFDEFLAPMTEYLHATNYIGDIAVNCIMNEKTGKLGFMEWTCRGGWPAFNIIQANLKDPCNWMLDLLDGSDTIQPATDVTVGLVMAIPEFPYTTARNQAAEGIPILGVTEKNKDNVHLCEVRRGKGERLESAGEYLMVITGTGKTVKDAASEAYAVADYIAVPNRIVRDDIGRKLKDRLPLLHKHDLVKEMEYE
jgi:phosphoribosylamine--glycine ligase